MGDYVMVCAIFVCLLALALIALSKPLQFLLKFCSSAILGGGILFLGQSLGANVGLNGATIIVSGLLGVPGAAGMLLLSLLL
ncbi:MAG: pro-sigmaK processing inhibitor BofA family protein [Anaerotignum sp.]|nr:pro-sigmaK processing inhibitor BofA family protein [Anaerotignum sp.]